MAQVFKDSMQVVMKSRSKTNLSEKLSSILEINIEKQMNIVNKNFTFSYCWSYGSVYWSIWHSLGYYELFQSTVSRNTSLAIVAPGIAALFATALGLLAAIPSSGLQ